MVRMELAVYEPVEDNERSDVEEPKVSNLCDCGGLIRF